MILHSSLAKCYLTVMTSDEKIRNIIGITWSCYKEKVASGLLAPENEKMMQLQFAMLLQGLVPMFEFVSDESIKILLEEPVDINRTPSRRIIDIVVLHTQDGVRTHYPIELKCFRRLARHGGGTRGGQNLGMYDYWMDIENIEQYSLLPSYRFGTHLALTDDPYYVAGIHNGPQVKVYSTNNNRTVVAGLLEQVIKNRPGRIQLMGRYSTAHWEQANSFYFIHQETLAPETN